MADAERLPKGIHNFRKGWIDMHPRFDPKTRASGKARSDLKKAVQIRVLDTRFYGSIDHTCRLDLPILSINERAH
jgi:hypothetical protein